jgi:hypothetical protein
MLIGFKRLGAFALLAAGAALVPSSCARNDSSIFIRACLATTDRTGCQFMVQETSAEIFRGSVDAAYAGEYTCFAAVENQLVAQGNATTLRTETAGVELYEAEVQVLDPSQGNAALKQFSVPISGYVDPSVAGQDGISGTEIVFVDAATLQAEAKKVIGANKVQTVVASVIVLGQTLGGTQVHSQEFLFPIDIYVGGTCYEPPGMGCCGGSGSSVTTDCRLGIDESTNCQLLCAYFPSPCQVLECNLDSTGHSIITSAHCPAHTPADTTCCNP